MRIFDTKVKPIDQTSLDEAAELLRIGQVVAFPTDTVYGLGAHAFNDGAVAALYVVKDRPIDKAIPLLLSGIDDLPLVVDPIPEAALILARLFWPGALTMVLPKGPRVLEIVSGTPGVAVRVPDHPVVPELIRRLGAPLATTSANRSGATNPVTAEDVLHQLDGRLPLILDGGPCRGGIPSTVIDLTADEVRVLRVGAIPAEVLLAALNEHAHRH